MRLCLSAAIAAATAVIIGLVPAASAKEYPIGKPLMRNGMEIIAVYLQPIEMAPPGMMRDAAESDIHLEADIHAAKKNTNGFAEGDWIPYLAIHYRLVKADSGQAVEGNLMPMVASDGPHYGDNVKLMGPGKYKLVLEIEPPSSNPHALFGRHTDKETGVEPWFQHFEAYYDFTFAGTGKKGGY